MTTYIGYSVICALSLPDCKCCCTAFRKILLKHTTVSLLDY